MKRYSAKPRSTPSIVNPTRSMLVSVPAFSFPLSTVVVKVVVSVIACVMVSVVVEVAVDVNVLVVIMLFRIQ